MVSAECRAACLDDTLQQSHSQCATSLGLPIGGHSSRFPYRLLLASSDVFAIEAKRFAKGSAEVFQADLESIMSDPSSPIPVT